MIPFGYYRFSYIGLDYLGSQYVNTDVYHFDTTIPGVTPVEFASHLATAVYTPIVEFMHTAMRIQRIQSVGLDVLTGLALTTPDEQVVAIHGGSDSVPLPPQIAAVVTFHGSRKHTVGKKFFGGIIGTANISGQPSPALVAAMGLAGDAVLSGTYTGAPGRGYKVSFNKRTHLWSEYTTSRASTQFGTQRRRKQGVGA